MKYSITELKNKAEGILKAIDKVAQEKTEYVRTTKKVSINVLNTFDRRIDNLEGNYHEIKDIIKQLESTTFVDL